MNKDIQIYVADIQASIQRKKHGVWIDATLSEREMLRQINVMLANSPVKGASDFSVSMSEGFGGIRIRDGYSLADISKIARLIHMHGDLAIALVKRLSDVDEVYEAIETGYFGRFDSLADFARQNPNDLPKKLSIDATDDAYQTIAENMEGAGEIFSIVLGDDIHVFAHPPATVIPLARERKKRIVISKDERQNFTKKYGEVGRLLLDRPEITDMEEAERAMEECYQGAYRSLGHFAWDLVQDELSAGWPDIMPYINFDKQGQDFVEDGTVLCFYTSDSKLHVFWHPKHH